MYYKSRLKDTTLKFNRKTKYLYFPLDSCYRHFVLELVIYTKKHIAENNLSLSNRYNTITINRVITNNKNYQEDEEAEKKRKRQKFH